ncbi:hypothetical protein C8F01DRAFT_1265662 [Mycena amicta]|nr:hypothetical protein C8F01DRAFT_1265662 [Mycena amicta]
MSSAEPFPSSSVPLASLLVIAGVIPDNASRFIALGIGSTVLFTDIVSRITLASRMDNLTTTLDYTNEILLAAQANCNIAMLPSLLVERLRLRRAEHARSKLFCAKLELSRVSWKAYPRRVFNLWFAIEKCLKEVRNIQAGIEGIVEEDNKRKLDAEIDQICHDLDIINDPICEACRFLSSNACCRITVKFDVV